MTTEREPLAGTGGKAVFCGRPSQDHFAENFPEGRRLQESYVVGCKFRFSASERGTEKVLVNGKWVRVEPGHLTASLLAPLLKPLAGYPEQGKDKFLAALDAVMPDSIGAMSNEKLREVYEACKPDMGLEDFRRHLEHFNRKANQRDKWFFANALAVGVLLLLAPARGKRSKARQAARNAFAAFEATQARKSRARKPAWVLLPYLQGAWERSATIPFVDGMQFGFEVAAKTLQDAACCELLLMITHNVRRLRVCPHCLTIHWNEETSVCKECKREQDRIRKARQEKTPERTFLQTITQAKSRKYITEAQWKELKRFLERRRLDIATKLYEQYKRENAHERKKAREGIEAASHKASQEPASLQKD